MCTNEWSRDEPMAGLAARRPLGGPAPASAKLGHQVSWTTMSLTAASCMSLSQSPLWASPLPAAPSAAPCPGPAPASSLLLPGRHVPIWVQAQGHPPYFSSSIPPENCLAPSTTCRHCLSVSGCPSASSTLPRGRALKLFSIQSCFPGDEYVKFSQSASLSWPLSLHSKSPCGKPEHPFLLPLTFCCSLPGPWASAACALSSFSTPASGWRGLLEETSCPCRLTAHQPSFCSAVSYRPPPTH